MAVEEVAGHIARAGLAAGLELLEVARAHLGGDLEADVDELADVGVVERVLLVVAQGADELLAGPAVDDGGGRELGTVDVDDGRVGLAELVHVRQGFRVDLLGEGEAGAAGFGEADDFLEPGRARGLHVDAGAVLGEGAADGRVDGELVAAAVDGELQVGREAVLLHRVGDDAEVVVELAFELGEVADVVDALVETAGELRGDGLDRHAFVGDGGEDDEQLGRGLGAVGLVHRDLGDEAADALHGDDVAVDLAGFLDGEQELGGRALDVGARGRERTVDAGEGERADELRVAVDEGLDRGGVGGLGDEVGDVDGEEVGDADETLDGLQADVVGVEEVRGGPAEGLHGGVGRGAGAGRLGADDVVLAVGLVPDRHDLDAELLGREAGGELGFGFVGEAVAHAEGEFTDDERLGGHTRG